MNMQVKCLPGGVLSWHGSECVQQGCGYPMDGHGYPGPRHHMPATGNGMVLMSEAKRAEANGRLGHELLMSSSGRALCCVMLCVLSCVCYVFCMLNMPIMCRSVASRAT